MIDAFGSLRFTTRIDFPSHVAVILFSTTGIDFPTIGVLSMRMRMGCCLFLAFSTTSRFLESDVQQSATR